MNDAELEKSLTEAIEADATMSPGRQERLRVLKRAEGNNPAMDQLATAIAGLLQIEQELYEFATSLVGPFKMDEVDKPQTSSEGPLIPRLRSDAELLARLAIRQHKLIQEIKARL